MNSTMDSKTCGWCGREIKQYAIKDATKCIDCDSDICPKCSDSGYDYCETHGEKRIANGRKAGSFTDSDTEEDFVEIENLDDYDPEKNCEHANCSAIVLPGQKKCEFHKRFVPAVRSQPITSLKSSYATALGAETKKVSFEEAYTNGRFGGTLNGKASRYEDPHIADSHAVDRKYEDWRTQRSQQNPRIWGWDQSRDWTSRMRDTSRVSEYASSGHTARGYESGGHTARGYESGGHTAREYDTSGHTAREYDRSYSEVNGEYTAAKHIPVVSEEVKARNALFVLKLKALLENVPGGVKAFVENAIKKVESCGRVVTDWEREAIMDKINEEIMLSFAVDDSATLAANATAANSTIANADTATTVPAIETVNTSPQKPTDEDSSLKILPTEVNISDKSDIKSANDAAITPASEQVSGQASEQESEQVSRQASEPTATDNIVCESGIESLADEATALMNEYNKQKEEEAKKLKEEREEKERKEKEKRDEKARMQYIADTIAGSLIPHIEKLITAKSASRLDAVEIRNSNTLIARNISEIMSKQNSISLGMADIYSRLAVVEQTLSIKMPVKYALTQQASQSMISMQNLTDRLANLEAGTANIRELLSELTRLASLE